MFTFILAFDGCVSTRDSDNSFVVGLLSIESMIDEETLNWPEIETC